MKQNKIILAAVFVLAAGYMTLPAYADTSEPLQAFFSSSGDRIKIILGEPIDRNSQLLIANETLNADIITEYVDVRTTILIDNSGSMPRNKRSEVLDSVRRYAELMPENESLRIAKFDTETEILAEEYSTDSKYIDYQLEKIDFQGQETYVYDALMTTVGSIDTDADVYYRTILITDGIDTVGGTSFDYLRTEISEQGRYHIDVVQVGDPNKPDLNLKAIGSLGSNTFCTYTDDGSLVELRPNTLWLLSAPLTNSLTTGELKGVTIKSGENSISLGSMLIPQAELPEPVPIETEAVTEPPVEVIESTTVSTEPEHQKRTQPLSLAVIFGLAALAAGGGVGAWFLLRNFSKVCEVRVRIEKEDISGDREGVGEHIWVFPVKGTFRVGRVLEPMNGTSERLPVNQFAICEQNDVGSIGRNAFFLQYDQKEQRLMIQNAATNAVFAIEHTPGNPQNVQSGEKQMLSVNDKILLGSYTNVFIGSITVRSGKSGDRHGK